MFEPKFETLNDKNHEIWQVIPKLCACSFLVAGLF